MMGKNKFKGQVRPCMWCSRDECGTTAALLSRPCRGQGISTLQAICERLRETTAEAHTHTHRSMRSKQKSKRSHEGFVFPFCWEKFVICQIKTSQCGLTFCYWYEPDMLYEDLKIVEKKTIYSELELRCPLPCLWCAYSPTLWLKTLAWLIWWTKLTCNLNLKFIITLKRIQSAMHLLFSVSN